MSDRPRRVISDCGRVLGGTDLSESDERQLPSPNFKLVAQTLMLNVLAHLFRHGDVNIKVNRLPVLMLVLVRQSIQCASSY